MAASVVKSPHPGKALDGLRTLGNDQGASVTRRGEKSALAWYVWSDRVYDSNNVQILKPCQPSPPKSESVSCERGNMGITHFLQDSDATNPIQAGPTTTPGQPPTDPDQSTFFWERHRDCVSQRPTARNLTSSSRKQRLETTRAIVPLPR